MSRLADLQTFVDECHALNSSDALEDLLTAITGEMGFDYFTLVNHAEDGSPIVVHNLPQDWRSHYEAKRLLAVDPVLAASELTSAPFLWDDAGRLIDLTVEHHDFRAVRERVGRIGNGINVPAHVPGRPAGSANFGMKLGRDLPLHSLGMAAFAGAWAFEASRRLSAEKVRRPLTDRQIDCLILVARGHTEREIGARLGISEETVKRHLKEARISYDASKTVQVLFRALSNGQLTLKDVLR